jgi:hypothetical protein
MGRSRPPILRKFYGSIGFGRLEWIDGLLSIDGDQEPVLPAGTPLLGLTDTYFFDPFPLVFNSKNYLLFEVTGVRLGEVEIGIASVPVVVDETPVLDFDRAAWLLVAKGRSRPGVRIPTSYPFVFNAGGDTYLVPEQWHHNNGTNLFGIVDDPVLALTAPVTIGPRLFDPNVSFHDDKFWLYGVDSQYRMRVFVSSEAVGPYSEHQNSRTVVDPAFSRNAGPEMRMSDRLLSPRQDCSRIYGASVSLYEIDFDSKMGIRLNPSGVAATPIIGEGASEMPAWLSAKAHHIAPAFEWGRDLFVLDGGAFVDRYDHGWASG